MRLRTCVFAASACTALSLSGCAVRLVNGGYTSGVCVYAGSNSALSCVTIGSASSYVTYDCSTPYFTVANSGFLWSVNLTTEATARATVLVSSRAPAFVPEAALFVDASSALPDALGPWNGEGSQPVYMDQCALRVLNAYGSTDNVTVAWWNSDCFNCAIPPSSTAAVPFLAASSSSSSFFSDPPSAYVQLFCGQSVQIRVSAPGGYAEAIVVNLAEHGAYTALVGRSASGEGTLQLLTDVAGDFPYAALIVGGFVMCALALLNKITRFYLNRAGLLLGLSAASPEKEGGEDDTGAFSPLPWTAATRVVAFFGPVWRFLGYDTYAREQQALARASAAAAKAASTASAQMPLLPRDTFGGVNGDNVVLLESGAASQAAAPAPEQRSPQSRKAEEAVLAKLASRIRSIDAFRGACLCFMIFFNTGGGGYWFMDHSYWNGLTVADLVFPCFVFTQGVSMAISFDSLRRKKATRADLTGKVIVRAVKLYAIGCFLNGGGNLGQWRFLGVLQYFSVGYLVVGLLETHLCPPPAEGAAAAVEGLAVAELASAAWGIAPALRAFSHDVLRYWRQWLVMAALAAIYLSVEYLLPVPGCPTGYLGPGGLANDGAYLGKGCTGGAHRAVDVAIFGEAHMYHNLDGYGNAVSAATCNDVYLCDVYDPEGVLGWASAAWQTWLGLQAGRVFVHHRKLVTGAASAPAKMRGHAAHLVRWVTWGVLLGLLGGGLCGFSQNDGLIPINKNLWSPTFVLCMSSIATLAIALFYVCVDMFPGRIWSGSPFVYPGMNSITVYTLSELLSNLFPFSATLGSQPANHSQAMASNLLGIACFVAIARWMYMRRIFINV